MTNVWKLTQTTASGSRFSEPSWEQSGVDWGNGTKPIKLWFKSPEGASERFVVFKVPSGKHWRSILEPSVSHPGSFVTCRLIEDQGEKLITEELFQMPVSDRGKDKT